ncbi:hypothetical protein ACIA8K_32285 [Catenuloplanes sp. NPDC051500]|uniref:hypothetical protein n=1 Tax=Catenuloplanes sp. NPDC051500 TaxID=3363959 RepID=UPI00379B5A78
MPAFVRQVVTDLLVVAWVYGWIKAGLWLRDLIEKLAVPGQKMEGAGQGLADNLTDAGDKVGRVPIAGDELTAPFARAAEAAQGLANAGRDQQDLVADLSWALPLALVAGPIALVLLVWLPLRVRWIRRAGSAASARGSIAGRDLLALRALTGQPVRRLAKLDPDVAGAWRRGDEKTLDALAALELRSLGLK